MGFAIVNVWHHSSTRNSITCKWTFDKSTYGVNNGYGQYIILDFIVDGKWQAYYSTTIKLYAGQSDHQEGTVTATINGAPPGGTKSAVCVIRTWSNDGDGDFFAEKRTGTLSTTRMPNLATGNLSITGGTETTCNVSFSGASLPSNETVVYHRTESPVAAVAIGKGVTSGTMVFQGFPKNTKQTRTVGVKANSATDGWIISFAKELYPPFAEVSLPLLSAARTAAGSTSVKVEWPNGLSGEVTSGMSVTSTTLRLTNSSGTVVQSVSTIDFTKAGSYTFSGVAVGSVYKVSVVIVFKYHDGQSYSQTSTEVEIDRSTTMYYKDKPTDNFGKPFTISASADRKYKVFVKTANGVVQLS